MLLAQLETLAEHGEINQDSLAKSFGGRYDPGRGLWSSDDSELRLVPKIELQPFGTKYAKQVIR